VFFLAVYKKHDTCCCDPIPFTQPCHLPLHSAVTQRSPKDEDIQFPGHTFSPPLILMNQKRNKEQKKEVVEYQGSFSRSTLIVGD